MISKRLMVPTVYSPAEIYFGQGAAMVLKYMEAKEFLVLVTQPVKSSEQYGKIHKHLEGKTYHEEIVEEPTDERITEIGRRYEGSQVEVIVGIGGGRVMDASKVVRYIMDNPGKTIDDLSKVFTFERIKRKLVLIPTTPGTGSEASTAAVIYRNGVKTPLTNKDFIADIAILDSGFLLSLPPQTLTPFMGDVFAHDFEAYFSKLSNPIVKANADASLSLLVESVGMLRQNPKDVKGLDKLQLAGYLGGLAQGNAYTGACHALAHGAENLRKLPHGDAVLTLAKPYLEWLREKGKIEECARFLSIYDKLGFEEQVKKDMFTGIADDAWADSALNDPSVKTSPIRMDKPLMLDLISFVRRTRS